jgi:hypothetical protein
MAKHKKERAGDNLERLLHKIRKCLNYRTLFSLESEFNKVGLTLQHTSQNWIVLCKIDDDKPLAKEVIDDFIFLAPLDQKHVELTPRALEIITDFTQNNASGAAEVADRGRTWNDGVRVYDKAIAIVNEDVSRVAQEIID